MKSEIVKMNPVLARKYLDKNKRNRSVSPSKVNTYVRDMQEGRWMENGESIIIDTNGLIKDGQHRLLATIKANHSWNVPVVSDVSPNVMDTIDTGKNRNFSDVLSIEGIYCPKVTAPLTKLIINWNWGRINPKNGGGNSSSLKVTNKIALSYLASNKKIILAMCKEAMKIYNKQSLKVFSAADIGLFLYIVGGYDFNNPITIKFVNLIVGNEKDSNSSATWFYGKMLKYKTSKETVSRVWKIGILIKCWNLYIDGNPPVTNIRFDTKNKLPKVNKVDYSE